MKSQWKLKGRICSRTFKEGRIRRLLLSLLTSALIALNGKAYKTHVYVMLKLWLLDANRKALERLLEYWHKTFENCKHVMWTDDKRPKRSLLMDKEKITNWIAYNNIDTYHNRRISWSWKIKWYTKVKKVTMCTDKNFGKWTWTTKQ